MVKHVILWQLKDELTCDEKITVKKNAKNALEALKGKIDGLVDIKVNIVPLPTSNADMMLDSTFVSQEALSKYQVHLEHKEAADKFVRPFSKARFCLDFEV